jgi:hypothetical protein
LLAQFLISVRSSVQAAQVNVFLAHPLLRRTRMSTDFEPTEREAALQLAERLNSKARAITGVRLSSGTMAI